MKKGESYSYGKIHKYSEKNDYEMIEHGNGLIGADFIVLVNDDSETISFVATGYNDSSGFIYECIYSDVL
jgi:hypothetical protein